MKKDITNLHELSTETFIALLLTNYLLYRRELNITVNNLAIKKPSIIPTNTIINAFKRYLVVKKLKDLRLNNLIKRYILLKELTCIQKLNALWYNVLKELGKLQRIKNYNILSKEDLIYALIRSINPNEDNYIFNVTTDFDTNEPDNEIRLMINDTKQLLIRIGNILTNKKSNEITKELFESLKIITQVEILDLEKDKKKIC